MTIAERIRGTMQMITKRLAAVFILFIIFNILLYLAIQSAKFAYQDNVPFVVRFLTGTVFSPSSSNGPVQPGIGSAVMSLILAACTVYFASGAIDTIETKVRGMLPHSA